MSDEVSAITLSRIACKLDIGKALFNVSAVHRRVVEGPQVVLRWIDFFAIGQDCNVFLADLGFLSADIGKLIGAVTRDQRQVENSPIPELGCWVWPA